MKVMWKASVSVLAVLLVAGCASTGGGRMDREAICALAGLAIGGAAGSAEDSDAVIGGAALGAMAGAVICAFIDDDSDGDGVKDKKDRCPGTVAGAEVDQNGCELDFDGDGVPDRLDECPDTPSGVQVDARGCELDSDGDGVPNSKDRCPNTPMGAKVDQYGCELDSDGDGVVDSADKCPGTPAGTEVDNNGCELAAAYELEGVNFEFDSARLTPDSKASLNDALKILMRHGDLEVEVAGHTDSKGAEAYNQRLSEQRAAAVRDYLVANGIDAARLTVKGYGESQPIADNANEQGRAENRRVEMRHD